MFYQYETELAKERERQELIARAQTDQLIRSIRPRRKRFISQLFGSLLHSAGHFVSGVGGHLVAHGSGNNLTRRSHATR